MKKRPANPIRDKETILDIQDYLKCKNYRDYVLFALGIATGYRAGDLVSLKVRDIKEALYHGYFRIMESKKEKCKNIREVNRRPREVKVVDKISILLKKFIRNKKDYEFVFQSRKGVNQNISVAHVSRILKDAGNFFGLRNISAHSMRKTYAYRIYKQSNNNIVLVKEMLNHTDVEVTKRYLGLSREEYNKFSDMLNDILL